MQHIRDLIPDPKNRRKHTERNVGMLVDALQQVGAARSIVIDEQGVVLAGNATIEAAAEAGITNLQIVDADGSTIVAVRRSNLSDEQKRRLALYDNRVAELAAWNIEQLAADKEAGLDLKPFFFERELRAMGIGVGGRGGQTDPDEVPDQRPTDIQPGDLFQLGEHLLLCGDSTDPADVRRLMNDQRAQLVFTDPPYGVDYAGGTKKRRQLQGDQSGTTIYSDVVPMIALASEERAPVYLWHAGAVARPVEEALDANRYDIRAQIIWNKNQAQFGALTAQYKQKHEPCFYAHRRGVAPVWFGPTNEVTVWDISRAPKNEFHPTQKPVELAERALSNSSEPGAIVLDLFGGSGSTLIACETRGRRARVMELDPPYVQVILDRWEAFTGQQAQKVGEAIRA